MIKDWRLVEVLDRHIQQFIGLGATDEQVRRLIDNWHIVSALASGRLASVFDEFIPVQPEKEAPSIEWGIWEEKLRHFPVTFDAATALRDRVVRALVSAPFASAAPFLDVRPQETGMQTLRMKVVRNRRPVTDAALSDMLCTKLLRPARLAHLLEFAAQHPDSVPPNLYATGSRRHSQGDSGEERIDIPCIRRAIIEDAGREERMTLMTTEFTGAPESITYPAMQTFLVERYPIARDANGALKTGT